MRGKSEIRRTMNRKRKSMSIQFYAKIKQLTIISWNNAFFPEKYRSSRLDELTSRRIQLHGVRFECSELSDNTFENNWVMGFSQDITKR